MPHEWAIQNLCWQGTLTGLETESADTNGRIYPRRQLKPPAQGKGDASCNESDDMVDSDADEAVAATTCKLFRVVPVNPPKAKDI